MYIVIKEQSGVYFGVTAQESNVDLHESDLVLDENLPFFKTKGKYKNYVIADLPSRAVDVLEYSKVFNVELNDDNMFKIVMPRLKDFLSKNGLINSDGGINNTLCVTNGQDVYEIDNFLSVRKITDFSTGRMHRHCLKGCLTEYAFLPPKERIKMSFELIGRAKQINLFPALFCNVNNNKKQIIYK